MLEKILKKKPLSDRMQFVNLFLVLNTAIHDPLIFMNIVERMIVINFNAWKASRDEDSKMILLNVLYVMTRLCGLIS